jgi:hypothetical protein
MFEHADWIGWGIGLAGLVYGIWADRRAKKKLDIAHAGLVSLKPGIQGSNREAIIAAINDLLAKLQK